MASASIFCAVFLMLTFIQTKALAVDKFLPNDRTSLEDCGFRSLLRYSPTSRFQRITDGTYPHLVHVAMTPYPGFRVVCLGSLIWENVILAKASCAETDSITYFAHFDTYVERNKWYSRQNRKIVESTIHPNYSTDSGLFDIALMKLETNVTVNNAVLPICLLGVDHAFKYLLSYPVQNGNEVLSFLLYPVPNDKCTGEYSLTIRGYFGIPPDYPQCPEVEQFQTCSNYLSGQINMHTIIDGHIFPLLVGMTCLEDVTASYIRITKFREWISTTLNSYGLANAAKTVFNVYDCSERFLHLREDLYNAPNEYEYVESSDVKMEFNTLTVKLLWPLENVKACYGAHTDHDVVITLAQCVSHSGVEPSDVMFYDSSVRSISEIIVHPNYTRTQHPNYNDIAIVKLKSPPTFIPTVCGWYGDIHPSSEARVKAVVNKNFQTAVNESAVYKRSTTLFVAAIGEIQCDAADYNRSQIPLDSQDKYFCLQYKPSSGQKSYKIHLGTPIYSTADVKYDVYGLNLNDCDCDFSTPVIGIRFSAHKAWLESVLLPAAPKPNATKPLAAFTYIDTDLHHYDVCGYSDGSKGMCETIANCPSIKQRVETNKQIVFCTNETIVCCPQEEETSAKRVEAELKACEKHYSHLRQERQERSKTDQWLEERSPHLVKIGWVYGSYQFLDCIGYLITTRDVITSASCLNFKNSNPNVVEVVVPRSSNSSEATFIAIRKVETHPLFDNTNQAHDIALLTLESAVNVSWALFPGCIWMNRTHSPVQQDIFYDHGKRFKIHQMYRSECEAYLKKSLIDSVICMFQLPSKCAFFFNPSIKETSPKCEPTAPTYLYQLNIQSYNLRTPVVGNGLDETGKRIEYLTSIYRYEVDQYLPFEFSNIIGIAYRVSYYTEWIATLLAANNAHDQ